ncbi:MAG: YbaY family lipoprotein [Gammaproteobacteria bacterium]
MKTNRLTTVALLLALLSLLPGCTAKVNGASQITGYIFPSADLVSGDKVHVRIALLDVSKMDVSAVVISEDEFQGEPSWPLQYKLSYDAQTLDQRLTYGLSVRISAKDGQLLAINDIAHQFAVDTDSKNFDVLVKPVRARVSSLAEIDMVCAEVDYRVSIYKDFLLRYNRRNRSRQIFIQKRSGSGTRYERDAETLLLKGDFPPLYLKGEENIKCSISAKE